MRDNLEWSLKEKLFEKIVRNFGPVTIDLFASCVSCKVNRYYYYNLELEAIGIDAFIAGVMKFFMRFHYLP